MKIRPYQQSDCKELAELFYNTVHTINARDYTQEQLNVWATGRIYLKEWDKSLLEHHTVVAVENNEIVGFGDIDSTGYLDRLFVHKNHQRKGVASAICSELERSVSERKVITHSSITARVFFENRGYRVIQQQEVMKDGVALINFVMELKI